MSSPESGQVALPQATTFIVMLMCSNVFEKCTSGECRDKYRSSN